MTKEGQGFKVLVADDEPEVVNLVRIMLEMEGYTILEAFDGEAAVSKTLAERPDLILLDVRMPRMSGLGVLDQLRENPTTDSIPVIMLSVVTTYPEVQKALERGAVAYLSKPFELREMARLVARVLGMSASQREALRTQALNNLGRKW